MITRFADAYMRHPASMGYPDPVDMQGVPDSKVHWANMGPIWGRQDPGGPHELCWVSISWHRHESLSIFNILYCLISVTVSIISKKRNEEITSCVTSVRSPLICRCGWSRLHLSPLQQVLTISSGGSDTAFSRHTSTHVRSQRNDTPVSYNPV